MMGKSFIILLLLICSSNGPIAQNIYSALHHDRKADLRANANVAEIKLTSTFYNSDGTERTKEVSIINEQQHVISQTRYNNKGDKTAKLTFEFDPSSTKSLSRIIERWQPYIGHTVKKAKYEYDANGHLIKVVDLNKNNVVIQETILQNNERGHPIELKLIVNGHSSPGKEIAEYDYENNMAIIKVIDAAGVQLSASKNRIDFASANYSNCEYNDLGDLIKSEDYQYEYKYDKYHNWTKQTIYKIVDGKKKKNRILKRKLKYR